jgi:hypothetical protein
MTEHRFLSFLWVQNDGFQLAHLNAWANGTSDEQLEMNLRLIQYVIRI